MDDLSGKIGEILSDPSMMEQIRSLGSMMGLGQQGSPAAPQPAAQPPAPQMQPMSTPVSGMSPEIMSTVMRFAPLLSSMNEENDSTRLLNALRPFISEKRRSRIDGSIRLLSFMRMIPMLKGMMGGII